jgi:hypothetical protein
MFNRPLGPFAVLYETRTPAQPTKGQLRYQRQKLQADATRVNKPTFEIQSQSSKDKNLALRGKSTVLWSNP